MISTVCIIRAKFSNKKEFDGEKNIRSADVLHNSQPQSNNASLAPKQGSNTGLTI